MKALKLLLFGIFCLASSIVYSQQPTNLADKVNQMHERKWQFLVEKSKLTSKEMEIVKPVFLEYEKMVWDQHVKDRTFFKENIKSEGDKKPDYEALNNHYAQMDLIQGKMFKAYHAKLCKLLSPETLFRFYHAEREFKRKLLQDMSNRRRPQDKQK